MSINNSIVLMRCTNNACVLHNLQIAYKNDKCEVCGSDMIPWKKKHWLVEVSEDKTLWVEGANEEYPCIISFEYKRLREFCKKSDVYGAILCLKDNFESILKFETLISYAYAAQNTDSEFEKNKISLITEPNPALGTWVDFAKSIKKALGEIGVDLPVQIPLDKIIGCFDKFLIVNWRNKEIGHGITRFEEDEELRNDLKEKIIVLRDLLVTIDTELKNQILYLKTNNDEYPLMGVHNARGIRERGDIQIMVGNEEIYLNPFIRLAETGHDESGVFFFDNQKKTTLSIFQGYAEGKHDDCREGYFEKLSKQLASVRLGLNTDRAVDDPYKTEEEYRELDSFFTSEEYIPQEHLEKWLVKCIEDNGSGIFLLQMDRGMGKSVFTEKLNSLFKNPVKIEDDLDIRTYHLNRLQAAGVNDMKTYIEWMWDHDYFNKRFMGIRSINAIRYEKEKPLSLSEAFVRYLSDVLMSRRGRNNNESNRILMVFDGLDEVTDPEVKDFFLGIKELPEGIYILYTSRRIEGEEILNETAGWIKELNINDNKVVESKSEENTAFLMKYFSSNRLSYISQEQKEKMIQKAHYRALELGILCRLIENGEIPDTEQENDFVVKYLKFLEDRYMEKEILRLKELLVTIALLGDKESLNLHVLGQLSDKGIVTMLLVGMLTDISPLLNVERTMIGNCFRIANADIAKELLEQIPGTDDIVRNLVKQALAAIEGFVENEENSNYTSGDAVICAHVTDFSLMLPEKTDIMGENHRSLLESFFSNMKRRTPFSEWKGTVLKYLKQLYVLDIYESGENHPNTYTTENALITMLNDLRIDDESLQLCQKCYYKRKEVLGEDHPKTLLILNKLILILSKLELYEEALSLAEEEYKKNKQIKGEEHPLTLVALHNFAIILGELGKNEKALRLLEEVYKKNKEMQGEEHPDTLLVQHNIAVILSKLLRYEEAFSLDNDAYEKMRRIKGDNHPDTLRILTSCISLKRLHRNTIESVGVSEDTSKKVNLVELKLVEEIFKRTKQILGENHPETLVAQQNFACVLVASGRYEEGLKLQEKSYEDTKQLLGEDHPDTLHAQIDLARTLSDLKRFEAAVELKKIICNKSNSIFGEDHSMSQMAQSNLAYTLCDLKQYEAALDIYKNLFERRKRVLGKDNPKTLGTQSDLADTLCDLGRNEEALKQYKEVYDIRKEVLGEAHKKTLSAQNRIAITLCILGRKEEALKYFEDIYRKRKLVLGEDHPDTLSTQYSVASTLSDLGKNDEAIKIYEEVYRKRRRVLGENHPKTLKVRDCAGYMLQELVAKEKDPKKLVELCEISKCILGENHPDTLSSQSRLAYLCDNLGRHEEALMLEINIYEKRKQIQGENHPDTMKAQSDIAYTLCDLGRYEDALLLYKELYEKRKKLLGEEHPSTLSTQGNYGYVLKKIGRYREALQVFIEVYEKKKKMLGEDHADTLKVKGIIEELQTKIE